MIIGHGKDEQATIQLDEYLSCDEAEELFPLSTAFNINKFGTYFDKDPWQYLENQFLVTTAFIIIDWVRSGFWNQQNLTTVGKQLITIVKSTDSDYQDFYNKIHKKDK